MESSDKGLRDKYSYRITVDLLTQLEEKTGYTNEIEMIERTLCDYVDLGKSLNPLIERISKLLNLYKGR